MVVGTVNGKIFIVDGGGKWERAYGLDNILGPDDVISFGRGYALVANRQVYYAGRKYARLEDGVSGVWARL